MTAYGPAVQPPPTPPVQPPPAQPPPAADQAPAVRVPCDVEIAIRALRHLFNNESTSDLALNVDGRVFHVHRDVIQDQSELVRSFLRYPRRVRGEPMSMNVTLPDIKVPIAFVKETVPDRLAVFELYLQMAYGIVAASKPVPHSHYSSFAIAAVAQFMQSERIRDQCDAVIAAVPVKWSPTNYRRGLDYAELHGLPLLKRSVLSYMLVHHPAADLVDTVFSMEPKQAAEIFADLVDVEAIDAVLLFHTAVKYGAKIDPTADLEAGPITVQGEDRIAFVSGMYGRMWERWNTREIVLEVQRITDMLEFVADTPHAAEVQHALLYKFVSRAQSKVLNLLMG